MTSRAAILWGIFGLAVGAAGAWSLASRAPLPQKQTSVPPTAEAATAPPAPQIVFSSVTTRLGADERESLRALIREELRTRPTAEVQPGADTGNPADPGTARDRLALNVRPVYDEATAIVDESVRTRTWTEADRQRLRERSAELPADARMAILAPLITAVNAGEVHFEGRGPLF
jgi:hypothetical protein